MKRCTRCKQEKPDSAFTTTWNRGKTKRVLRSWCRECRAAYDREKRGTDPNWHARHRSANKRYVRTAKGKATQVKHVRKYRHRHPAKARAHDVLNKAIRRGEVAVTGVCQRCGSTKRVERHHEDYSKPLEFEELCRIPCHRQADAARQALEVTVEEDSDATCME